MKKMNNKGFSLVELIIVIAIMAILAASIAPALIRYIDKSRKSNDITAAGTIKTAVETALANETAYEEVVPSAGSITKVLDVTGGSVNAAGSTFATEVSNNLSTIPKIKYKKDGANSFVVFIDGKGVVTVYIGTNASNTSWMIQPTICADYQ